MGLPQGLLVKKNKEKKIPVDHTHFDSVDLVRLGDCMEALTKYNEGEGEGREGMIKELC